MTAEAGMGEQGSQGVIAWVCGHGVEGRGGKDENRLSAGKTSKVKERS